MDAAGVESIEARGLPTLGVTITRALGNVNTMRRAILKAQIDGATQPADEPPSTPKKANAAKRKSS